VPKAAFIDATVIVIAVSFILVIQPDLEGSFNMLLLLLAVVLGYFGIRETE
jgi:hypothetical protein